MWNFAHSLCSWDMGRFWYYPKASQLAWSTMIHICRNEFKGREKNTISSLTTTSFENFQGQGRKCCQTELGVQQSFHSFQFALVSFQHWNMEPLMMGWELHATFYFLKVCFGVYEVRSEKH